MRTILTLTLLVLLPLAAVARAADTPPRTVATTGEAIVYATPNEVTVTFGIETFNGQLDEAKAANDAAAGKLVAAIKGLGIEEKHIATDTLQVQIHYKDYNRNYGQIEGYIVRRAYAVKLKDTKLFEKLVETGLKNGANQLHGVAFQTTELRKYRDQARQMAIKAAKEKAMLLTKELDTTVGKPRTISEGYNNAYFGRSSGNWNVMSQNAAQAAPPVSDTGDTLPLGQLAVQASVSVTFDLAD